MFNERKKKTTTQNHARMKQQPKKYSKKDHKTQCLRPGLQSFLKIWSCMDRTKCDYIRGGQSQLHIPIRW